jgi:hypothetical protein
VCSLHFGDANYSDRFGEGTGIVVPKGLSYVVVIGLSAVGIGKLSLCSTNNMTYCFICRQIMNNSQVFFPGTRGMNVTRNAIGKTRMCWGMGRLVVCCPTSSCD